MGVSDLCFFCSRKYTIYVCARSAWTIGRTDGKEGPDSSEDGLDKITRFRRESLV